MTKIVLLSGCIAMLCGCAAFSLPQTREEYVQFIRDGGTFLMVDTHVSKRQFDDVVNTLKQKAPECFDADHTMRRTVGGMTTMNIRDEYRTAVRVVNSNRAELTTQY